MGLDTKLITQIQMQPDSQAHHQKNGFRHQKWAFKSCHYTIHSRAVHGSGQVGFGPDLDLTRLNRVTKIATHNRPNIWGRPSGSGHQLIGSDWSVWRVWASIWAEFVILHNFFFFFNSISERPFGPKLMVLFLTTFIYF